ncbi:autotransporter outer membrane beta-barrel domain-containing protein [Candidatus Avelusimicrobium faecicola]|uniref:autotransporter outer membrane beta-barrel domain-containing protein n=1 Tax=Candidatus Avelusimicrobium faecicola TaxID=3416205 RepID=UPI003D0B5938
MSKHHSPQEENIYSSACIQALEQEYCSSCSAAVVSSCIVSRGFGERLVSRIYNGGRRAVYTAAVGAMLANNTALPAYGAGTYVSAGKTVTGATITSGNSQIIYSAGVADSTTIYGGLQVVSPGGVATNTTMSQDGWQFVSSGGVASNTTINPGGQRVSSGGVANTTIINSGGAQHLQSGGVANATTINSRGWQQVEGGGLANGTTINSLGWLNVASGGVASNTTINSVGNLVVSSGGVANTTIINSGGSQNVYVGGVVSDTTIHDGGLQFVYFGGKTYNVRQHSGGKMFVIVSGGDAETYVEGTNASGETFSLQNGRASNFILYSGGSQHVKSDGGTALETTIHGGAQYVSAGGTALETTIHGGEQYVSAGGVASVTTIHGGAQYVSAGGTALETTIHGGEQYVSAGGVASNTTINEGGLQNVSSGAVVSSTIVAGGTQNVSSGGKAYNVMQYSGGNINADVYGGDTETYVSGTNASGEVFTLQNGVASNFILYAGGLQNVSSGAVASDTLVAGGTQNVYSSGVASNTTLNSGAVNLYEGGLISGLNATGGDLNVYGNNTLQGNINLADAQVNINHTTGMNTLGIENLSANNAVFNMNVDLETQTADKLNITDSYSGNANLKLTNVAPTAQATTGDGIKLVEFADTATVNGTFDLLGGKWDEGGYVYKLAQGTAAGTGQDYYLRNTQELTDTFKTMLNVPIMNVVIAQTGMNSLQKRLGDLRAMDNTQAKQGVWVRSYYKDMTVDDLIKTDANLFGAEAGYDWLFRAEEPTKLYAGVLVGFVSTRNIKTKKSDGVYDKGDGEAPGVGVYATLLNENGWFVDLAARNFWSKLDMKNHSSTGTELAYKPNRNVVAASVEVGKSINSELARNKFIRIEPKLEIGYMHASAENASVGDTGNDIRYNAANYVNAKAGVLLAYNAVRDNGLLIEPLLELAYRYEFAGKDELAYAGAAEKSDLSGGTLEVNAGLDMQLTKNLYWYGLGSYETGNIVKGWGVHAGIRYAFGGTQDSSAAQTPANATQKGQVVKKAGEPQKKNGKETDSPNKALKERAGGRSPASQK